MRPTKYIKNFKNRFSFSSLILFNPYFFRRALTSGSLRPVRVSVWSNSSGTTLAPDTDSTSSSTSPSGSRDSSSSINASRSSSSSSSSRLLGVNLTGSSTCVVPFIVISFSLSRVVSAGFRCTWLTFFCGAEPSVLTSDGTAILDSSNPRYNMLISIMIPWNTRQIRLIRV